MAKLKRLMIRGEDVVTRSLISYQKEHNIVQPLWKIPWQLLKKLNISTVKLSHSISGYLSKRNEDICPKTLHVNVHGSIIFISQKLRTLQPTGKWMPYLHNGILFSNKKEQIINTKTWTSEQLCQMKEARHKGTYFMIIYKILQNANLSSDRKEITGVTRKAGGRGYKGARENFRDHKAGYVQYILIVVMVSKCLHI